MHPMNDDLKMDLEDKAGTDKMIKEMRMRAKEREDKLWSMERQARTQVI